MKPALRKKLRGARRALSAEEHRRRSRLAAQALARLPGFSAGKRVAVYLPFDRETDTAWLIEAGRRRGVQLFVPVIDDKRRRRMSLRRLAGALSSGHYGIRIPHRTTQSVAARWMNLIVLPLVGVDGSGYRLGMGAGFYDRALAFRRHQIQTLGPVLAGLAFDAQRTESRFAQAWDIRLDYLASESGLERFNPQG
jgi:5-formyltetrahydrofolate cyclo-ligase